LEIVYRLANFKDGNNKNILKDSFTKEEIADFEKISYEKLKFTNDLRSFIIKFNKINHLNVISYMAKKIVVFNEEFENRWVHWGLNSLIFTLDLQNDEDIFEFPYNLLNFLKGIKIFKKSK
jgi:hypothetical protein